MFAQSILKDPVICFDFPITEAENFAETRQAPNRDRIIELVRSPRSHCQYHKTGVIQALCI